jgi:hypothetical protein
MRMISKERVYLELGDGIQLRFQDGQYSLNSLDVIGHPRKFLFANALECVEELSCADNKVVYDGKSMGMRNGFEGVQVHKRLHVWGFFCVFFSRSQNPFVIFSPSSVG